MRIMEYFMKVCLIFVFILKDIGVGVNKICLIFRFLYWSGLRIRSISRWVFIFV